jgi:3-keto-disaccharide hydrolase
MNCRSRLGVALLALSLIAGLAQGEEKPEATDGFAPMFDGKTLAGWQTTGNWVVEEAGVVALHPRPGEEGWQRYDAYLTTARKYKDFVIDLEFKIGKGGNSGVFLRVGDPKSQVDTGFEVQILDTHGKENPGNHDCGGVIGTAAPSKNMAKPAGEWNRYVITCQGNRLKVKLNGEQIIDLELDKSAIKDRPAQGHIGFQDEAKPVWYRNVRIKELNTAAE